MEEIFSKEVSFNIIAKMITQAKDEYHDKGEGWLLWGWLLTISSLSSAILVGINLGRYVSFIWYGMAILVIIFFIYEQASKKPQKVKTYVQEMLNKFGTGFFLSLITVIIATSIKGDSFSFGYFFILYAFWMFIHGSAIRFKPLIIGAIVNWAAAVAIFMVADFKYAMIISAVAVAIGYLVPGYMLRQQYNKSNNSQDGV